MRAVSLLIAGYLSISFILAADTTAISSEHKTAPSTEAQDLSTKRSRNAEMPDPHQKSHRREVRLIAQDGDTASSSSSRDDTTSPDTTSSSSTPSTSDSESESEAEVEDKKTEGLKTVTDEKKETTPEEISAIKKAVEIADLRTKAAGLSTDAMLALRQSAVFSGMAKAVECENPEEINTITMATLTIDIHYMQQAILHAEETIAEGLKLLEALKKLKDASTNHEEKQKAEELCEAVTQGLTENRQKIHLLKRDLLMKILMLQIQTPEHEETPTT